MKRTKAEVAAAVKEIKEMNEPSPEMMQAVTDHMQEYTENLIDLPMTAFCQRVEPENVGQLNVIRLFLDQKLFEVDAMCSVALKESTVMTGFTQEKKEQLAALFSLIARIDHKRGFVDYLIMKRSI